VIRLEGHASAGFRWEVVVEDEAAAIDVRTRTTAPPPTPAVPESFNVDEQVVVVARAAGHAVLRLQLRRPWETESLDERVFNVTVSE
jgi:predicted secreted protein